MHILGLIFLGITIVFGVLWFFDSKNKKSMLGTAVGLVGLLLTAFVAGSK